MSSRLPLRQWSELLSRDAFWCYLAIGADRVLQHFIESRPDSDVIVRIVRGEKASTTDDLLDQFAQELRFPAELGLGNWNWNSFIDCMTDLSWLPASHYVIAIANVGSTLSNEDDFRQFIEVLEIVSRQGVRTWPGVESANPGRMTFLLHAEESAYELTIHRLKDTGLELPSFRLPPE